MTKKTGKKEKATPKKANQEIVIRVEAPAAQIKESEIGAQIDGGKYMIPKSWMSEKQVTWMVQKTPRKYVMTRKGKGGQVWDYVPGWYVEKVLNYVFAWNWDFEVVSHGKEGELVWVLGKLTVKDDKGHVIIKNQFGRADIKFKSGTKIMVDFGNDLKAAATDSLKKCASLLGIASDIYGKGEMRDMQMPVQPDRPEPTQSHMPATGAPVDDPVDCQGGCGAVIDKQTARYSEKMYGKKLCRDCQATAKLKK